MFVLLRDIASWKHLPISASFTPNIFTFPSMLIQILLHPIHALCLIGSAILSPLSPVLYSCVLFFFLPYLLLFSPWWNCFLTMVKLLCHHGETNFIYVCKWCSTREKEMGNTWERMLEQVYSDSQTGERNWANLLERIRYNKYSEDITMSSRS